MTQNFIPVNDRIPQSKRLLSQCDAAERSECSSFDLDEDFFKSEGSFSRKRDAKKERKTAHKVKLQIREKNNRRKEEQAKKKKELEHFDAKVAELAEILDKTITGAPREMMIKLIANEMGED